ncbi:MAG: hypothetical protein KDB23_04645 [Planctomycetales bacterium]|nr:hypothetical protein [Planctomycetales bacterium]
MNSSARLILGAARPTWSICALTLCLLFPCANCQEAHAAEPTRAADGFWHYEGKHLTLITDIEPHPALAELTVVFDQAVPLWAEYFQVDVATLRNWHLTGHLMSVEARFRNGGYLPDDLPPFLHGYQRGTEFWFREQASDYYRRHLMLHEGTHGFMHQVLHSQGPGWYMEGVAELLATHEWADRQLRLNHLPERKELVPDWGRIRILRDAYASGKTRTLREVMATTTREFQAVEGYAWSWAAAAFLDAQPQWSAVFRTWSDPRVLSRDAFNEQAWAALQAVGGGSIEEAWQIFLQQVDYGYDIAADAIQYQPSAPPRNLGGNLGWQVDVDPRAGWQATGILLDANRSYHVTTTGRYQIMAGERPWHSEAGGITLRYCDGRPLGALLGAVRPSAAASGVETPASSALLSPIELGTEYQLEPSRSGELFVRINERAGQRSDNVGQLTVQVAPSN